MTEEESHVGSLAEETLRLLGALGGGQQQEEHHCPHGWCPLCHVVDLVADHPELLDEVTDAASRFGSAVIDLVAALTEGKERD